MKQLYIIALLICSTLVSIGQEGPENRAVAGRLQAYKIAFLTQKLSLSPEEAQRFWPVYNQYQQEMRTARITKRSQKDSEIESEQKMLDIRKKYNSEFGKVLSAEKVNTLFRSEKEFGTIVQKELMDRRQQKGENRKIN